MNSNGTINLITGSVDIGGTRTAVAMQAAEVLGLRSEDIYPDRGADTDSIGYTARLPGGSRIAFDTGLAAISAAEEVKTADVAPGPHMIWEVQPEDVDLQDGVFVCAQRTRQTA